MTWRNRLRLLVGAVAVLAVVVVATVLSLQRQTEAQSMSASIAADSYPVGVDYSGTMIQQLVEPGDVVDVETPLAVVQSNALVEVLAEGRLVQSNSVYDFGDDGLVTIKAPIAGVVSELAVRQGGYVAAGTPVVTIDATDSLYVEAVYALEPVDYARVEAGARVDIETPDLGRLEGEVRSIDVDTTGGVAHATILVDSEALHFDGPDGLIGPGTPVVATLHLRQQSAIADAAGAVGDAVQSALATIRTLLG